MISEQRYSRILDILKQNGIVKTADLIREFDVSSETVRRDLFYLEEIGELKRVYGGAVKPDKTKMSFMTRQNDMKPQKQEIAEKAISLMEDGDVIALDCGTTAMAIAELLLREDKRLTILTHSLAAFQTLVQNPNITALLTGGEYMADESALYGTLAEDNIKQFHVNKVFLCPSGVSLEHGYTDFMAQLVRISKEYLQIADKSYYLVDSSKFEHATFMKIADVHPSDIIITDSELPDSVYALYKKNNLNVIVSEYKEI